MKTVLRAAAVALALVLAACDAAPPAGDAKGNDAVAAADPAANEGGGAAALASCPFRATRDWIGSVERGHVRVNGYVDLMMAGFRPALTERPGAAAGTIALDLALVAEPQAAVSDRATYERRGAPSYRRGEIWCGGERIAAFDMVVVD